MKTLTSFLILLAVIFSAIPASAQNGLNISTAFSPRFRDIKGATETLIVKDRLKNVNINTYHSLSLTGHPELAAELERMVRADGAQAITKEVRYKSGHLYYGFYRLRPQKKNHSRYILYLNGHLAGDNRIILLFLEGEATPEQVKNMLK